MSGYTCQNEACEAILEAGRRLYLRGLVASNDGNISARMEDGSVWATPTGVSKGYMTRDMLVHLSAEGELLEGSLRASSEIAMHLLVYRKNPALAGVVHAHGPAATAYATLGKPFDLAISLESAVQLGVVPCAPYAVTGSPALAASAAQYCMEYNAAFLEQHGAVSWGKDVMQALFRTESLEHSIVTYSHMLALGEVRLLTKAQIADLQAVRERFGITTGGIPRGRE
ncbi:MAG: class II aldolase/adducin family protein [Oscillospiraceae bacterium]|jgi:L-fuculose-phosphate aldolase|nr:class II aldolase/adducin family protein [Oscillospiraceae bacterium]